jgi:hypothetical protein
MSSFAEQNPHSCQYCRDFSFDFRKTGNDAHKETQIQRFKSITWMDNKRKTYDWDEAQSFLIPDAEKRTPISEFLDQERIFIFEQTSKTVEEKVDEGCCLFTFLLAVEEGYRERWDPLHYYFDHVVKVLEPVDLVIVARLRPRFVRFGICYLLGNPLHLQMAFANSTSAGVGTDYGVYLFCYFSLLDNCHTYLRNVYRSTIIKEIHLESDES